MASNPAPKLLLPVLARFYEMVIPLAWPIVRVAAGIDLAIDGWMKVVRLPRIFTSLIETGSVSALGPQYDVVHNVVLTIFEFGGGICVALGLFTRFFAPAAAIELAIITFGVLWPRGYQAYGDVLWRGLIMFAIALRGGGPYSLDRRLGREL